MIELGKYLEHPLLEKVKLLQPQKVLYLVRKGDDQPGQGLIEDDRFIDVNVHIFTLKENRISKKDLFSTEIRKSPHGSLRTLKEIVITAINKKLVEKGDHVLCIADESVSIGYKGILTLIDVDHVLFNISLHHLSERIAPSIIEAVIDIAAELSLEGREGKKIGTGFVIGNKENILKHVKQLILNPFLGYSERKMKITDPEMRETVKEFSQLDGVFIIDTDGSIITSCAYLDVPTHGIELTGFGTRHLSCAAITKAVDCIAIVLSSTGTIRVFKDGKIVMKV